MNRDLLIWYFHSRLKYRRFFHKISQKNQIRRKHYPNKPIVNFNRKEENI